MQTGHFLFGNYLKKDEEVTDEHVMMATACFAWHMYILSICVLALLSLAFVAVKKKQIMRKFHEGSVSSCEHQGLLSEGSKLTTSENMEEKNKPRHNKIRNE